MFYIDESGSMPKVLNTDPKHRYFVIALVHTSNPRKLKSVYKKAIQKLRKSYPLFFAGLANPNECKASEMLPFMKLYVLEKLMNNSDMTIAHMVVNNIEVDQIFRNVPGRSFNFLVKIVTENFRLTTADKQLLELKLDNRNVKLEGLSELEGYLYNSLALESSIVQDVKVEYWDSCDNLNIQVADLIANVIYQRFTNKNKSFPDYADVDKSRVKTHPYTSEFLYQFIKPKISVQYVYPVKRQLILDAAATISL